MGASATLPFGKGRLGKHGRLLGGRSLGLGLASALAGCSLVTERPPQVDVASVALTEVGLFNPNSLVTLCVTNPNSISMAFENVTFRIAVADASFAAVVTESAVAIPALASVLVPIAAEITIRNLPGQLLATVETGSFVYRLSGVVHLARLPFGVPFSRAGQLSLLQAGEAYADAAASPAATRCQSS